ncbi:MAG: glycogen/starch synthase [Gemmataceae bacterium]|nr:glycogen/starch synthase [Gemmataceae bacterium]
MRVFHVATECANVVSVGGLGDVVFQLAKHGALQGIDTTVILPKYGCLDANFTQRYGAELAAKLAQALAIPIWLAYPGKTDPVDEKEPVRFAEIKLPVGAATVTLCFVDSPRFARRQQPYGRPAYVDYYPINLLLQKAALARIQRVTHEQDEVVIHGHDAHVGMLPLLARHSRLFAATHLGRFKYVTTAHNCGWGLRQRLWMKAFETEKRFLTSALDVPWELINTCVVEDGDIPIPGFEPFAAAALYGDHLTVVSEGYCWELLQGGRSDTAECDREVLAFARFLEKQRRAGLMRARLIGITNGIDPAEVGPEALPPAVRPTSLRPGDFAWKPEFRRGFLHRLRQPSTRPEYWREVTVAHGSLDAVDPQRGVLFTCIGRADRQKGMDLLARAIEETFVFHDHAALCLLGGSELPELKAVAQRFPGRVAILDGRSESVAKEIYAAGDFFLIPSRFEPCGLVDYRAQLNGNIPVANQVGGLAKIIHGYTGLGFFGLGDRTILRGLVNAIHAAIALHADAAARPAMMARADAWVRQHHTWDRVFPAYRELYSSKVTAPLVSHNG